MTEKNLLTNFFLFDEKTLKFKNTIGSGSYGNIHKASTVENENFVVKQNFIVKEIDFIGSIKELDLLIKLKKHPFIIDIKGISIGNPFKNKIGKKDKKGVKTDDIFFLFDEALGDLEKFIYDFDLDMNYKKLMFAQLLLGMEYIHSKGIVHRDLKPSNLLWTGLGDKSLIRRLKICDFGLSKPNCFQESSTPRTVTEAYRAPEISLCYNFYNDKSDIWSIACIFYEILCKDSFISIKEKKILESKLLQKILCKIPRQPSKETVQKMDKLEMLKNYVQSPDKDIDKILNIDIETKKMFDTNHTDGYFLFKDLLLKMLEFDPEKRISATECLNHDFFNPYRNLINDIRKTYPIIYKRNEIINIYRCNEREYIFNLVLSIYEKKNELRWYKHQILFLSLDMFDRYLHYLSKIKKIPSFLTQYETTNTNKKEEFMNRKTIELHYYVCLYISYKYYNVMSVKLGFCSFINYSQSINSETMEMAKNFEKYLLQTVFEFNIYRQTLLNSLDLSNIYLDNNDLKQLLIFYKNYNSGETLNEKIVEDFLDKK